MEFHPNKCSVIQFSNKRDPINFTYNIHGINLEIQNSAKYLGLTIDNKLSWNDHCDSIYKKASYMLSFLERNLQRCPPHIKQQCFSALVRPILDYGCCVWDPHKAHQINKLEKINKRAGRFILGNYKFEHGSTKTNMNTLGWPPLQERRAKLKLTMFYKIINDHICVSKDDLLLLSAPRRPFNFYVPRSKIDIHLHSFFPSTIRLWNSLPNSIHSCNSLSTFKSSVEKITILKSY